MQGSSPALFCPFTSRFRVASNSLHFLFLLVPGGGKESWSRRESAICSQRSQLQRHQSRPRVTRFPLFGKQERQSHVHRHCHARYDLKYTPSGLSEIQITISLHVQIHRSSRRSLSFTANLDLHSLYKRSHGCQ